MRYKTLRINVTLLVSVILSISCAEIESPPGGLVDRQGPFLLGSDPPNGSTDVLPGNKVSIFFSERIIKPENVKTVFISPRPTQEPEVKWKSDRVDIVFADSFQTDQTYIVSLSSAITDLRRNKIDSALMVAFTTGSEIDSGRISGIVTKKGKPLSGIFAALFEVRFDADRFYADSIYPSYLTQTNSEGYFSFAFLPQKTFYLVAFTDRNRDELFDPDREPFALPDREITVGGELPLDMLRMRLISRDTIAPEIISVTPTTDGLIRVRLNKDVPTELFSQNEGGFLLWAETDSTRMYKTKGLLEADTATGATFHFWLGRLPAGKYFCRLTYDHDRADLVSKVFEIKITDDNHAPELVSFEPGEIAASMDNLQIIMTLSEPIDTGIFTDGTFLLWDEMDRSLPLSWQMADPFRIMFESDQIESGRNYRLAVTEFEIADLAGNLLGDTLRELRFSTLDFDSLGSIQGTIISSLEGAIDKPIELSFISLENNQIFDLVTETKQFKIDLPAGKYQLVGFVDANGDGKQNFGSIKPFTFSETTIIYADTIAVRARFETAGIEVEIK